MVPVPLGVPGELYIAGEGLARGYHGRPELTAERFVANPFSGNVNTLMYRTGDLVRCIDGSNIEYIERLDNQVKIRGYRIELGEIEAAINDLDAVNQNVVGTYESAIGVQALVVYIVQEKDTEKLSIDVLRAHLNPRLPGYMIPAIVITMEALPLTANNKVDRKALPKPSDVNFTIEQEISPPTNRVEREIIDSWKKCLGVSHIGSEDSFVVLGGDSLTFVQASMALEDILGHTPDNWEILSINELSKIANSNSLLKNVDSTVLIRALAITSVVLEHFVGFANYFGAATNALFIASGYLFANFQLQAVCARDNSSPILSSIIRISIPTILYTAMLQIWVKEFHIENLLLVGNFMLPDFAGGNGEYWFLHVLVQILLILMVLLSFGFFRRKAKITPFSFAVTLLAISAATLFVGPYFWDTNYLFNRVPHMQFWLFMIGWCIFLCNTITKKIFIAVAIIILCRPWVGGDLSLSVYLYTFLPGLLLLAFPVIRLVFPVNRLVHYIGGASLFIYLTHFQFSGLYDRLGIEGYTIFNVLAALIGGVIFWRVWDILLDKFHNREWTRRFLSQGKN